MLYEYNAKTYPYSLYGDTKVDEMPYQNDPDSIANDMYEVIPKFSELMPKASELTNSEAIAQLPQLLAKYQADEAASLERMRRPNPLMDEDWGKSKMEIVSEALKAQKEEERKAKLLTFLQQYNEEADIEKNRRRLGGRERRKKCAKVSHTGNR